MLATDGQNYFLVKHHLETDTCVPDAPIVRVEMNAQPSGDCAPILAINLDEGGAFFVPRMRRSEGCAFPIGVNVVQPNAVPRPLAASPTPAPPPAPTGNPTPFAAASADPFVWRWIEITDTGTIASAVENAMGTRAEFIVSCNNDEVVWIETLQDAELLDHQAVGLTARTPHINRAVRYPVNHPELAVELTEATVALAEAASRLKDSSRADHAPLASLWTKRTLRDYGPSSCGELYDFTIGVVKRRVEMTVKASSVGYLSRNAVFLAEGQEAADRHWEFLNALGDELLIPVASSP
ncbi:TPA: hypothetical protein DDZ10_03795 [Candidatus Uhrbacteria bacterium]|nr:hypothetical protein [Candidatus Uhrbacteria bacterium]